VTESEISGLKPSRGKRMAWMGVGTKEKIVATEAAKRKPERVGNHGKLTNATISKPSPPSIASQTAEKRLGPPISQKHHRRPSRSAPANFRHLTG
jgi:hypothetical protein